MEKRFYQKLVEFDFSEPCALCTVMEWKGSVPRKDYPMMLVCQSGKIIGTIGGGTMEKNVIDLALASLKNNKTLLESFDFTNDNLSKDGGLCGGTVKIAIEPYTFDLQSFWAGLNNINRDQAWLTTYHLNTKEITRHVLNSNKPIFDIPVDDLIDDKKIKQSFQKIGSICFGTFHRTPSFIFLGEVMWEKQLGISLILLI